MGKICEIFGPITTPFYVVRWAAVKVSLGQDNAGRGMAAKKKKRVKKGLSAFKAGKAEMALGDDAVTGDDNEEDEVGTEAIEMAVAADGDAQKDVTVKDGINVVVDAISEIAVEVEVEERVNAECSTPTPASTGRSPTTASHPTAPSNETSAAQAEHFASLISRALPGTSGNTRATLSIH